MIFFAVDDEPVVLENLHDAIAEAEPGAQIRDFRRAADALAAAVQPGQTPDVVFSDIQMPDMDGLQFAVRLKTAAPDVRIVFVTAYAQYALEAWKKHVNGYLIKPVSAEDIREVLDNIPLTPRATAGRLFVRCFGDFEVFWQGRPLTFERRQTKELLAFLVDKRGAVCTAEEVSAALWEDETDIAAAKTRLRSLVYDLRGRLSEIGVEALLIRKRGMLCLNTEMLDCDYYRMLDGELAAVNAYRGEYMRQYSWAEVTAASLYFGKSS